MSYVKKGQKLIPNTEGIFPIVESQIGSICSLNRTFSEIKSAYERNELPIIFAKDDDFLMIFFVSELRADDNKISANTTDGIVEYYTDEDTGYPKRDNLS